MRDFYHSGRALSALGFVLFMSATVGLLFEDVLVKDAALAIKHWLVLVILLGTILAGHLCHKAPWLSLSRYGFALLFLTGTGLVVLSSVGRQGEAQTITAAQADMDADARRRARLGIEANQGMLDKANAALAAECKSGRGKRCEGIKTTIAVYEAAVAGNQATLDKLGPPKPVAPEADKLAEFMHAAFSHDREHVKALTVMVQPFFNTLFYELGCIVTLGFALRGRKTQKGPQLAPQPLASPSPSKPVAAPVAQTAARDNLQSSYPQPQARELTALKAAGLITEGMFKRPDRWCYERELC